MSPALFPRGAGYVRIVTEKAPRREGHGASLFLCYAVRTDEITSPRSGTAPGMRGSDASADCGPKQYACSGCSHDPRTEP